MSNIIHHIILNVLNNIAGSGEKTISNVFLGNKHNISLNIPLDIPPNSFGVFVSIKRHHKLPNYPYDIHGCIGYWNPDFKPASNELLYQKALEVANNAYNESRSKYFTKPLKYDLLSTIEAYFMLNSSESPILKIDANTGIILGQNNRQHMFNNRDYGLIVQNNRGYRATYLPEVFPDTDWSVIKRDINQKAGISNRNNRSRNSNSNNSNNSNNRTKKANSSKSDIKYYAYSTKLIKMSLIDFLKGFMLDKNVVNIMRAGFCKFVENTYATHKFIPYSVSGDIIEINKNEDIRNISTIRSIIDYNRLLSKVQYSHKLEQDLYDNIQYYVDIYMGDENSLSEQAISFLAPFIPSIKSKQLCDRLMRKITSDSSANVVVVEREFELGEILLALLDKCKHKIDKNKRISAKIMEYYDQPIKSVFQFNWDSQVLRKMGFPNKTLPKYTAYINNLYNDYIAGNIKLGEYETNYLAVIFEGLMQYYAEIKTEYYYTLLFGVYIEILCRYNIGGYINFLDGSARMDIMCHFLDSF